MPEFVPIVISSIQQYLVMECKINPVIKGKPQFRNKAKFKFDDISECEIGEDGIPLEKGPGFVPYGMVR